LIAALLNSASDSSPAAICSAVSVAQQLLGGYAGKLPYGIDVSSPDGQAMVSRPAPWSDTTRGH